MFKLGQSRVASVDNFTIWSSSY